MPVRNWTRDREDALPRKLDDVIRANHPARFVAAFVDEVNAVEWAELGANPEGHPGGAPAYDPLVLLEVWLYGFMCGIRSCRKLAVACEEELPFVWLTGGQRPDHNTLWRFYQRHRAGMRVLFKHTVATAAKSGLVVWTLQAVDGTKIGGNAAKDRTFDAKGLAELLEKVERAIAELEAQNGGDDRPTPPSVPSSLATAEALRTQIRAALEQVRAPGGPTQVNLTDPEAVFVKGRLGLVVGYNAQAAVAAVTLADAAHPTARPARLLTAVSVVAMPDDHGQLLPMVEQVIATTGQRIATVAADAGYHDIATVAACAARGQRVVMPEAQTKAIADDPYHQAHFAYAAQTDRYTCPEGKELTYRSRTARTNRPEKLLYRSSGAVCRVCPAFGTCTEDPRQGRCLEVDLHDAEARAHRVWMAEEEAKTLHRQRKVLIEPVFGVMKEELGGRRFHLRGLANVEAEWTLLATAFNLRTCSRLWQQRAA